MNSISTHSPRFLEFLKFSVGSRMDSAYSILTLEPSLLSNQPFALFKEPALSAVEGVGDHEPVQPPGFLTAALAKRPSAMRRRPIRSTKGWRSFTIAHMSRRFSSVVVMTVAKGQSAIQVIAKPEAANGTSYALVKDVSFRDGVIEVDLAGQPASAAFAGARGFIGIAFRVQDDGRYEYIYLRPTNGRADDQVRRNHSTQYSSYPDFDFARSRQEAPEKYESYVDLQPGVWTKYKIEVEGRNARLYVNGAEQPCLIVNDLKLEPRDGGVALWVGPGTEGDFSNLKITAK